MGAPLLPLMSLDTQVFAAGGNGTQGSPYIIETANEFISLVGSNEGNTGQYFKLGNNITLPSNYTTITDFNGYLDGSGFEIAGLNKALFNRVQSVEVDIGDGETEDVGGVVENLNISANVTVANDVQNYGILTNGANGAILKNISGQGTLTVTTAGSCSSVGGLVGEMFYSSIENMTADIDVVATNCNSVGGLIGSSVNSLVTKTGAFGSVVGNNNTGGLVGFGVCGDNGAGIRESFAAGVVSGNNYTGGLIGNAEGSECSGIVLENVYARGSVTGNSYVGGLAGLFYGDVINRSYSTGLVQGESEQTVGGLVGEKGELSSEIIKSFWSAALSGVLVSAGGVEVGFIEESMKDEYTYTNWFEDGGVWDFESIWSINENENDDYPCLQWSDESCAFSYSSGGENGGGSNEEYEFTNPTNKTIAPYQELAITDLAIEGDGNSVLNVNLYVNFGTLEFGSTTGLTFTGSSMGPNLQFSGTRSAINAALQTLTFSASSEGQATLEAIINGDDGEVLWFTNGHVYKVVTVSGGITWDAARDAATAQTFGGVSGYLATIIDEAESAFVLTRIDESGWIGASDSIEEGEWNWVTGPEAVTKFWTGGMNGTVVEGKFHNWRREGANLEPNDSGSGEDCAQIRFGVGITPGTWNDSPCDSTFTKYVVEFGGIDGELPEVVRTHFDITVGTDWADLTTVSATNISKTSATINGSGQLKNGLTVNDVDVGDGGILQVGFHFNTSATVDWDNYTHTTPVMTAVAVGGNNTNITFSGEVTGLECGTQYWYVAAYDYDTGEKLGVADNVLSFTTTSCGSGGSGGSGSSGGSSSSGGGRITGGGRIASQVNTTAQVNTPATTNTPATATCPADQLLTQNLKAGARNGRYHAYTKAVVTEVKILQAHMNRLGFNSGAVDGILGPITDGAIKRMQIYLGTKADGYVGPITRSLINTSCGAGGLQKL